MRQAGRLEELYADYGDKAAFLVVYIREAHAADSDWPLRGRDGEGINDPKSLEERQAVAKKCANKINFSMPMVIDELSDVAASAYGGHPDRLYIVGKDGRVAFQGGPGPRGFRPDDMEDALKEILATGGIRRAWRF